MIGQRPEQEQPRNLSSQMQSRFSALEQENALLKLRLQTCEQAYGMLRLNINNSSEHRLLEATAKAANALLTIAPFNQAVNTALQILGESLNTDRIAVHENFDHLTDTSFRYWRTLYNWNSENTVAQVAHPEAGQGSYEPIYDWYIQMERGQNLSFLINDAPEPFRSGQIAIGVKATHFVPISVEGQFWGILGLDDCREAKRRSAAELAVLQIAADCIGSAIQRNRTQQALLQAEQARSQELAKANEELQQREHEVQHSYRLLSVVAAVSKDLLESTEIERAIAEALQQIGEAAGISRITLLQEKQEANSGRLQHWIIQEWTVSDIPKQMDDPATKIMYSDEYGTLVDELRAGRSVWHTVEEFPEPARSQQAAIEVKSTGAVPIFIEGEYFGCVAFDDCTTHRQWTPHEIDVLASGTGAIGAALHRQQLVDRLIAERLQAEQERAAELAKANEALKRGVERLVTSGTIDAVLDSFLLEVIAVTNAAAGAVMQRGTGHEFSMKSLAENIDIIYPFDPHAPEALYRQRTANDTSGIMRRTAAGEVVVFPVDGVETWFPEAAAYHSERGHRTIWHFPFQVGGEVAGYLGLAFCEECSPSAVVQETVQALALQVSLALEAQRLAEEAKQAAIYEERNRMASEIHDTLAQAFTGISLQLEVAKSLVETDPQAVQQILNHISQLAEAGLSEARRSVWALYPPAAEYADLAQLLYDCVEQMTRNTTTVVEVNLQGTPCPLTPFIGMNLLRIGQEALTNALKHAQAETIAIDLTYESDRILLTIRDNGRGFTPPDTIDHLNGGFGLMGMYERCDRIGAQFSLSSQPGQGTQILVEAPLS